MKQFLLVQYTYRQHLDESGLRELTKRFGDLGEPPGTVAHYVKLDGTGGFTVVESRSDDDRAKAYETMISYGPWVEFEMTPVTTMDEALPSILKVYG